MIQDYRLKRATHEALLADHLSQSSRLWLMTRRAAFTSVIALLFLRFSLPLCAQDILGQALTTFPARTFRVEYSNSAKLRSLPNYTSLRQRYLSPRLQKLEESLAQLGIKESDVDELMLGWQETSSATATVANPRQSGKEVSSMDLYGLAAGRFDDRALGAAAANQGLTPNSMAGQNTYCLAAESRSTCIVLLESSLGAFATSDSLNSMLKARQGKMAGVNSDARFAAVLQEAKTEAPIWGVAVGPAISDWFRTYMPGQDRLQLNWSQTFKSVEDLTYSIDPGEKIHLDVNLDCTTAADATSLRQMLDGLKAFQQMAWQTQHPNQPNPLAELDVDSSERRVTLKVTTSYSGPLQ
jgi:hypothetical protein